jgi:signal transduction histidine kinase
MDLPAPLPSSLFRIAEETLAVLGGTATLRDAQVAVERSDGAVQIVVRAEGVPPAGTSLASALPGVYERAALFGGHVAMERDARGISVRVIVPLEPDVGKDEVPHEVPHQ